MLYFMSDSLSNICLQKQHNWVQTRSVKISTVEPAYNEIGLYVTPRLESDILCGTNYFLTVNYNTIIFSLMML
jgi:hypothetical protein